MRPYTACQDSFLAARPPCLPQSRLDSLHPMAVRGRPAPGRIPHLMASSVHVGKRLTAGFAVIVALTTALGLYCLRSADRIHAAGDAVATNWFPAMHALAD